jgi:hypothetical protein
MRGVLDAITPGRPAQGLGADAVKPVTLRGYHGTPDKNSVSAPRVDMKEPGAWFTKNVNYANDYAKGPDGRIFEADITLRNPAVVNFGYNDNGDLVAKLGDEVLDIDNNVDLVREMRRRGYDGLHTPDGNFSEADETFVAFNDDQIAVLPDALSTKAVANDATSNASRAARNAARAAARADATPPLPAPRNAAEAAAKDVLDLRAAGRASEVTDEMMAATDDQYMYFNTPIDMDEASRMARADEMGRDVELPMYHGGSRDFSEFRPSVRGKIGPGVYLTPDVRKANRFSGYEYGPTERIEKILNQDNLRQSVVYPVVATDTPAPMDVRMQARVERSAYDDDIDAYRKVFGEGGYDGVRVEDERTILDPTNIRSRFARFDPEFRHLRNLSAGVGGLGLLSQIPLQEEQY